MSLFQMLKQWRRVLLCDALTIAISVTNQVVAVSFEAQPFTDYRLQRRTNPSVNTNWIGAAHYDFQAYHFPVVLFDTFWTNNAWYEVVGQEVGLERKAHRVEKANRR